MNPPRIFWILRRIPYFDCIRYALCILLIEHALNAVVKKINSLVSFSLGDNFLFSLGILRALYLSLPFDIVFEFLSF